jgi:hypothetical protein
LGQAGGPAALKPGPEFATELYDRNLLISKHLKQIYNVKLYVMKFMENYVVSIIIWSILKSVVT